MEQQNPTSLPPEKWSHEPVMAAEVLRYLDPQPGDVVLDGTLGLAGHASMLLDRIRPAGTLIGLDWDSVMLQEASRRLGEPEGVQIYLRHANYRQAPTVLHEIGLRPTVVLLDLGLSSVHLDDPSRGMAFRHTGPLDMRMDRSSGEPAAALLNRLAPHELERIFHEFGDERWAKAIAKKIVERRREAAISTTDDLVDCVLAAVPVKARDKHIHPATRVFQALRIAVNHELEDLEEAIEAIAATLVPGGKVAVLSYHSGEDGAVKRAFRSRVALGDAELLKKPLQPTPEEVHRNPRSRSARLRVLQRAKSPNSPQDTP